MKSCLWNSEYKNQMQRLMAKCAVGLLKQVLMTSHVSKILSSPTINAAEFLLTLKIQFGSFLLLIFSNLTNV